MPMYNKPLTKGIIARLNAVTAVTDLVSARIYTFVPQQQTFPYIKVSMDAEPFADKTESDSQHNVRVQAWSRKATAEEALDLKEAIFNALDRQEANITLDSGTLVRLQYDGTSDIFVEGDGKTTQVVIEFKAVID